MTTEPAWFGDPGAVHEPGVEPAGTGWRPVCSCGFSAPLTHDTKHGALRAAQTHAAVSSALPTGRYSAVLDGDTVHIRCDAHPDEPLASFPGSLDGRETEALDAIRAHERDYHDDEHAHPEGG